jgi:hypothetical protein
MKTAIRWLVAALSAALMTAGGLAIAGPASAARTARTSLTAPDMMAVHAIQARPAFGFHFGGSAFRATKNGPLVTCDTGYRELIDNSGAGYAILGHGVGNGVSTVAKANGGCWANVDESGPTCSGCFQIEDESGRCLNVVASTGTVDEPTRCDPTSAQQLWAQRAVDGSTNFYTPLFSQGGGNYNTMQAGAIELNAGVFADALGPCSEEICLWSA